MLMTIENAPSSWPLSTAGIEIFFGIYAQYRLCVRACVPKLLTCATTVSPIENTTPTSIAELGKA